MSRADFVHIHSVSLMLSLAIATSHLARSPLGMYSVDSEWAVLVGMDIGSALRESLMIENAFARGRADDLVSAVKRVCLGILGGAL